MSRLQVVEDPDAAAKVKRVVCVSAFILILNVICYAVPFAFTKTPMSMVMLLGFGFGIPACGYLGAKNRSKSLLGCFWCCNACNLAILIALLIASSILLAIFAVFLEFLPDFSDCCDQFRSCGWDASSNSTRACETCARNQTGMPIVYMEGSDMCTSQNGEPVAPTAFAYVSATAQGSDNRDVYLADDSASGSGDGDDAVCLGDSECRVLDFIKGWKVTRPVVGIFLALFIVLMIPTVRHFLLLFNCVSLTEMDFASRAKMRASV